MPCSTPPAPAAWRRSSKEAARAPVTGNGSAFRSAAPPPRTTQPPATSPRPVAALSLASRAGDTEDTGSTVRCRCLPSANLVCSRRCEGSSGWFRGAGSTCRPPPRPAGGQPPPGPVCLVWIVRTAPPQAGDRGLTVHCSTVVSHDLGNSTSVFTGVTIKTVIVLSFFVKVLRFMEETLTIKAVKM